MFAAITDSLQRVRDASANSILNWEAEPCSFRTKHRAADGTPGGALL